MAATEKTKVSDVLSPDHAQHLRLLEALIFAGTQALDEKELSERLPNDADVASRISSDSFGSSTALDKISAPTSPASVAIAF